MKRRAEHIAVALFAVLYVTTSMGLLIRQVTVPCVSFGIEEIIPGTRPVQRHAGESWLERRHMPMVWEVPETTLDPVKLHLKDDLKEFTLLRCDDPVPLVSSFYPSCLSDRAPPRS